MAFPEHALRHLLPVRVALAAAALAHLAHAQPAPVQKQVPIPGLTIEESVRLETANEKLKELAIQREQKNKVRRDEIEKLIAQVEDTAKGGDDLAYQTARERLISYIFASNNQDHRDLSQIVFTVKETQVLSARARIALEQLTTETRRDSSGINGLLHESQERFRKTFMEPNQREIVLVSSLLTSKALSGKEEQRLNQFLEQLTGFEALMGDWQQPLTDIPHLPTQIDPAFDNGEAVAFLGELNRHLRFDYKDLEIQLFWSEILAEIGRRYAAGKLPLVRVQSALNRLGRLSGDFPQMDGKPWFMGALGELASIKAPKSKTPWQIPKRGPKNEWSQSGASGTSQTTVQDPEELLQKIHRERREGAQQGS